MTWAADFDTRTIGDPLVRAVVDRYGWNALRGVVVSADGRLLADRQVVAALAGRSAHTVRARCEVVARDHLGPGRNRALYDVERALARLADTRGRSPAGRRSRSVYHPPVAELCPQVAEGEAA